MDNVIKNLKKSNQELNEVLADDTETIFNSPNRFWDWVTTPHDTGHKWYCDSEICKGKEVKGIEIYVPNGADDNDLGEVVCAECGTTLWED